MKTWIIGGLAVAALGFAGRVEAQVQSPQEPLQQCGKLPYSVRISNSGGEIQAELTGEAAEGILAKIENGATAMAGTEYITGAISGASEGSISRVIDFYACLSRNELRRARATPDQREAFEVRLAALQSVFIEADKAVLGSQSAAVAPSNVYAVATTQEANIRAAMAKPLDAQTTNLVYTAMRRVKPTDFTQLRTVKGWGKVRLRFVVVGACGGVVANVLERTHGDLQVVLSTTPSLYLTFFGSSPTAAVTGAQGALSHYARLIKLSGTIGSGAPPMTPAFQQCTEKLVAATKPAATTPSPTARPAQGQKPAKTTPGSRPK